MACGRVVAIIAAECEALPAGTRRESVGFGKASERVQELTDSAMAGGRWYDADGSSISFVETDKEKWWSGVVYEVGFEAASTETIGGFAATYSLDISQDEAISPGSSSPWNGWIGWFGESLVIAWQNTEAEAQGAVTLDRPFEVDEQPTEEQWASLARLVTATCFESS